MSVTLSSTDLASVNFILRDFVGRVSDLTPLMKSCLAILAGEAEDAFAGERSPEGVPWAQLAYSTQNHVIAGKPRGAHPMLQVSGRLAALTLLFDAASATVGASTEYAALQLLGGVAGRSTPSDSPSAVRRRRKHPFTRPVIPARPYLGVGPQGLQDIEDAADAFMLAALATR